RLRVRAVGPGERHPAAAEDPYRAGFPPQPPLPVPPAQSATGSSAARAGDRYAHFAPTPAAPALTRRHRVARPPRLHRDQPAAPLLAGPALVGAAPGGRLRDELVVLLSGAGVEVVEVDRQPEPEPGQRPRMYAALVYDATGVSGTADLAELYEFFHPH